MFESPEGGLCDVLFWEAPVGQEGPWDQEDLLDQGDQEDQEGLYEEQTTCGLFDVQIDIHQKERLDNN